MNNIAFTAHLNSNLVSNDVARKFASKTYEMPSGTMYLYKSNQNGHNRLFVSLEREEKANITDRLELDALNLTASDEHKVNILTLCYRLLQENKQYQEKCAKLAQQQGLEFLA